MNVDQLFRLVDSNGRQVSNSRGPAVYLSVGAARNARSQFLSRERYLAERFGREVPTYRVEVLSGKWQPVPEGATSVQVLGASPTE